MKEMAPNAKHHSVVATGVQLDLDGMPSESAQGKALNELARLMRDIAEARDSSAHNESLLAEAQKRFAAEYFPLMESVIRWKRACLSALLKQLDEGWMRTRQKKTINEMVEWLVFDLQENFGQDLSDLIKPYLGIYFETDKEREEIEKDQQEFGKDFDEFMSFFEAETENTTEEKSGRTRRQYHRPQEKTKAQKHEEEKEQSLLGDMRGLYLMLARALHPDKETDTERRAEKTAWMQKVTAAYQARNLHSLFDILARNPLNAIGPYLATTPVATLKAYAKRLRRELTALRLEATAILTQRDPRVANFFHQGRFNEPAFRQEMSAIRRMAKATETNAKGLLRREGILELIEILKVRSPEDIL